MKIFLGLLPDLGWEKSRFLVGPAGFGCSCVAPCGMGSDFDQCSGHLGNTRSDEFMEQKSHRRYSVSGECTDRTLSVCSTGADISS